MSKIYSALTLYADQYNELRKDDIDFLKAQIGIQDEDQTKAHVLAVQAEAYAVYPYPCIRQLDFISHKIPRNPAYEDVLKLGKERPGAIFLELGCCFGSDVRRIIADGFPRENVVASDLYPEFWALGHKLFKTTQETYPVTFVPGDVFDPSMLSPEVHVGPRPDLRSLRSLTPLQGHVSVLHTSFFFHLFLESRQRTLAWLLSTLLSPEPGSMIIGSHRTISDSDGKLSGPTKGTSGEDGFAFSATGWKDLWVGKEGIFKPEQVRVWTLTTEFERKYMTESGEQSEAKRYWLTWSITRL